MNPVDCLVYLSSDGLDMLARSVSPLVALALTQSPGGFVGH